MNSAHWHLLLNHFPILGTYFSTLLLIVGILLKNQTVKNTALGFFILTSLLAIPVLLTGEGAEDILDSIGLKNEYFISQHERLAQIAFWLSVSIGVLSIGALIGQRTINQTKIFTFIILTAGLLNSVLMTAAGIAGGEIRHTEIRTTNSSQTESDDK